MVRKSGLLAEPVGEPVNCEQGARITVGIDDHHHVHLLTELAESDGPGMGVVAVLTMAETMALLDRFAKVASRLP
jgi:hypothetical protein